MYKIIMVSQTNSGGVNEYIKNFVKYLDLNKYQIELILSDKLTDERSQFYNLGCPLHFLDMSRNLDLKKDILAIREIRRIMKNSSPDLIYAHSSKAGFLTRLAVNKKKIPIIYNAHGWAFNMSVCDFKKSIYSFIERLLAYNTSKIITISDFEKETALERNISDFDEIITILNGIDINKKSKIEKDILFKLHNIPSCKKIIGQVSRIDEQKNPLLFVEIAAKLLSKNNNLFFILVGDGMLRQETENRIDELGIRSSFLITGWVLNPEDYINIFDIGLVTSKWEGFGLVIAEYMLVGVPTIASKVDGIPNIIEHNVNGILCESGNRYAFSKAVEYLLENPVIYNRFSQNGKKTVLNKFSMERVVNEHYKVFSNILD